MSEQTKPAGMRSSNLELFRIISMLFIVAHHYVIHGGLLSAGGPVVSDPFSFHSQFILVFGAFGKIGINCFLFFSGYFMCRKDVTLRKYLKLLFEILFYKILVTFIFGITGYEHMSFSDLVSFLLPIRDLNQDFYTGYLVYFLFIPFLNIMVHHMTERQHVRLLFLLSFVYIFLGTVPGFSVNTNNSVWFMCLYFISSYISLYPKKIFDNAKFWKIAAPVCFLLCILSVVICSRLCEPMGKSITSSYSFVMDSNTLLAVLTALSGFMLFRNLKIPQSKVINTIASTTFGVLLLHANGRALVLWIWTDVFDTYNSHATTFGYLHAFGSVLIVFTVASMIDLVRINLIEKPFFRLLDRILPGIVARWRRFEDWFFEKCHIE